MAAVVTFAWGARLDKDKRDAIIARGDSLKRFLEDENIKRWFDHEIGSLTTEMIRADLSDDVTRRNRAAEIQALEKIQRSMAASVAHAERLKKEMELET